QYIGLLANGTLQEIVERQAIFNSELMQQLQYMAASPVISLPPPEVSPVLPPADKALVILNNGVIKYQQTIMINGLTWRVEAGQHWQITGPNGAGKSTLLSLITGDHPQGYNNDLTLFGRRRGSGETIWDIKQYIGLV